MADPIHDRVCHALLNSAALAAAEALIANHPIAACSQALLSES
jgi:hypothetical protein